MSEVVKLYNPETFASLLIFLSFVGFGIFLYKGFWPWYTEYKKEQQQQAFQLENKRLDIEADSDKRWQETTANLAENVAKFTEEVGGLKAHMSAMVEGINRLYRLMANGKHNDFSG